MIYEINITVRRDRTIPKICIICIHEAGFSLTILKLNPSISLQMVLIHSTTVHFQSTYSRNKNHMALQKICIEKHIKVTAITEYVMYT